MIFTKLSKLCGIIFLLFFSSTDFASSGYLFTVASSGTALPQTVNFTLCLNINGASPLSCQNYTANKASLTIYPNIPNRTYTTAGIRINTPGYSYGSTTGLVATVFSKAAKPQNGLQDQRTAKAPLFGPGSVLGLGLSGTLSQNRGSFIPLPPLSRSNPSTGTLVTSSSVGTTLSSSRNPSHAGDALTFTAVVMGNNPTGTVTFTADNSPISSSTLVGGVATFTVPAGEVPGGKYSIQAFYNGDTNNPSSTSNVVNQLVNPVSSTTRLDTSANPTHSGLTVGLTATVTGVQVVQGGGSVTFQSDNHDIAGCSDMSLNQVGDDHGTATATCDTSFSSEGDYTIQAFYSGNNSNHPSISAPLVQVVEPALPSTSTTLSSSLNPSHGGPIPLVLTASVKASSSIPNEGTIKFSSNGSSISGCGTVTVSNGVATCLTTFAINTNPYNLVATYSGSSHFAGSSSTTFNQYAFSSQQITVPSAPINVTAVPGNGKVTLSWFPPDNTGGEPIISYSVSYGKTGAFPYATLAGYCSSLNTSCVIQGLTDGRSYTFIVKASNDDGIIAFTGSGLAAYSSAVTPSSQALSASPSLLALSGLGGGASRVITFTNTSSTSVTLNTISIPSFPTGTAVIASTGSCTNGATLAAGESCIIAIKPGSNATSGCTTGTTPTADNIIINYNNNQTVTANVLVLGTGCIYQGGYIYLIDDSTPPTSSIGGNVLQMAEQTGVWMSPSPNIWGIFDTSTIADPQPNAASSHAPTYMQGQLNCNAVDDGACDTNNIVIFNSSSAAGSCTATSTAGYMDWYLPSICELGVINSGNSITSCSLSSSVYETLIVTNIITYPTASLNYIWSSTAEGYNNVEEVIWGMRFNGFTGSWDTLNMDAFLSPLVSFRCARALTL